MSSPRRAGPAGGGSAAEGSGLYFNCCHHHILIDVIIDFLVIFDHLSYLFLNHIFGYYLL
jgi:hypothetical protein